MHHNNLGIEDLIKSMFFYSSAVRQILSLLRKPKPKSTPAVGDTDNKMSPTKGPLVSNAADLVVSGDDQLPKLSAPHDQTSKIVDSGESTETKELDRPPETISSKG